MKQLVDQYNSLVDTATGLGLTGYKPVKKFATKDVGLRRIAALQEKVGMAGFVPKTAEFDEGEGVPVPTSEEVEMAKKKTKTAKPAKAKRGRPVSNGGTSVREYTEQFNALVSQANKLGIKWARHHSSLFGSKEIGAKRLADLKKAIASAR